MTGKSLARGTNNRRTNVEKGSIQQLLRLIAVVLFAASIFSACTCETLFAQSSLGSLAGNIADHSGAVIPNAQVTAINAATGTKYTTTSTSAGYYRFPSLQLGHYEISVEAAGFKKAVMNDVLVEINTTSALNVTLDVGQTTQSVTVSANGLALETETSDIGTVVSPDQVRDLPLGLNSGALRSPQAFIFLTPGTTGSVFLSKISGGQNYASEVLLDGADIERSENGANFDELAPSVEAIHEFKVIASTMPAEFGRTTGGVQSFTIKSGTNQYHGEAYEILQNEDLNANSWFNNAYMHLYCAPDDGACRQQYQRPSDKENDYGVTLGGPVWIPRLYKGTNRDFFFFSWEQFQQAQGAVVTSTVPSTPWRTGDFSNFLGAPLTDSAGAAVLNPCTGAPVLTGQIFDPATQTVVNGIPCRMPFAGNKIDPSRFSPIASGLLKYWPSPVNNGLTNNYTLSSSFPVTDTTYSIREDHSFSDADKLFLTYTTRENTRQTNFPCIPLPQDNCSWPQAASGHFVRVGWDYTFSPNSLNHLNVGFNRTNLFNGSNSVGKNPDWTSAIGIKGVPTGAPGMPAFGVGEGIASLGSPGYGNAIDNGIRLNDDFSWAKGRHNFKFGGDYRYQQFSNINVGALNGSYSFARAQTAVDPALTSTTGNGFASFLLGALSDQSLADPYHQPRYIRNYFALFAQDDFKVSSTLVLNLGVRWDVDQPWKEAENAVSNFSPTAPNPAAGGLPGALIFGTTCHCNARWLDTWYKNIFPRIGFAWSPLFASKSVLRGGYGIIAGPLFRNIYSDNFQQGYEADPNFYPQDGYSATYNIDNGFPAFAPPPNLDPSQANNASPNYQKASFGRPPYIQNWSLQLQRELATDLLFTVGYVGQHSLYLRSDILRANNIPKAEFSLGSGLNAQVGSPEANALGIGAPYPGFSGTVAQAIRPFPQIGFINTQSTENLGQSTFNALEVTLQRRFYQGLNLLVSYTWAKILTDADSVRNLSDDDFEMQDPTNVKGDKAVSAQDVPHNIQVSYIYQLPVGLSRRYLANVKVLSRAISGFQIGGIQSYTSGTPMTFCCANGIPGWDNSIRFNHVAGQSFFTPQAESGHFNPFTDLYLNRAAFTDPNPAAPSVGQTWKLGDINRVVSNARTPWGLGESFSIAKVTPITERVGFELRADLLNAFNRHIWNGPDTGPYDNGFGKVTGSSGPRFIQFTARIRY